jgi:hypothetical protein
MSFGRRAVLLLHVAACIVILHVTRIALQVLVHSVAEFAHPVKPIYQRCEGFRAPIPQFSPVAAFLMCCR